MNPTEVQFCRCSICREGLRGKFKGKSPALNRRCLGALCTVIIVCLGTISCKKREPINVGVGGELKFQPAKFVDAIPAEYGTLVGVTQNPTEAAWVGLWFQKSSANSSDQTINAVFVNVNQGRIYEKVLTIPRK